MNEFLEHGTVEFEGDDEVFLRIQQLFDQYFPEDKLWAQVEGMDDEDMINFAYGQLIEAGLDPEEVLAEFGLLEEGEDDEI